MPAQIVVMGVSGTGKTSVGRRVAEELGSTFVEGDDHHPSDNVAKMTAGVPLADADRRPWLEDLAETLADAEAAGRSTVLTCSALRRSYRDILRRHVPEGTVLFVHLHGDERVLADRIRARNGHFMPPSLLRSQLETLEPLGPDEDGVLVDVGRPLDEVVVDALEAARGHAARLRGRDRPRPAPRDRPSPP